MSVIANKLPIEVIESKEGLDSPYVWGFLLVCYRFNLFGIDSDTICSNDKAEKPGRCRIELALLNVRLKAYFSQSV